MSIEAFDEKYSQAPTGFRNVGATCYFNAMLQSLLSCSSFCKALSTLQDSHINELFKVTRLIFNSELTKSELINSELAPKIWYELMKVSKLQHGQQDAYEAFTWFIDYSPPKIKRLFTYRRHNELYCYDCKNWYSKIDAENTSFEVEPDLKNVEVNEKSDLTKFDLSKFDLPKSDLSISKSLNDFLLKQNDIIDTDSICSKCKSKCLKFKVSSLRMVPEILFVVSKKYEFTAAGSAKKEVYTDFPKILEFKNKDHSLIFEAVAQIEHSGSLNGGHYWAICRRKNGWFTLNDMSVSPGEFKPTNNTYIVVYHFFRKV